MPVGRRDLTLGFLLDFLLGGRIGDTKAAPPAIDGRLCPAYAFAEFSFS